MLKLLLRFYRAISALPPESIAALTESLESGVTVACGMAPNGRPFSMFIRRRAVDPVLMRHLLTEIQEQAALHYRRQGD